jgi:Tfp pilus assembly protein PilN
MNTQHRPCPHMKGLLSGYLDGSLKGILRWYAHLHVSGCPQCTSVLEDLRKMLEQLRGLKSPTTPATISPERALQWEQAFDAIDESREKGKN